jgi:protein required for attachment to host cells
LASQSALIVVADRETARFFRHAHPGAVLEAHGSDISRPSPGDMTADRPGRTFDSVGAGRHAMDPQTSYKDLERQGMAHAIVERIEAAVHAHEVERLALLIEPQLLGELRPMLSKPVQDRVVLENGIHLTQAKPAELAERLTSDGTLGLVRDR